jgi:hypothetical protein
MSEMIENLEAIVSRPVFPLRVPGTKKPRAMPRVLVK